MDTNISNIIERLQYERDTALELAETRRVQLIEQGEKIEVLKECLRDKQGEIFKLKFALQEEEGYTQRLKDMNASLFNGNLNKDKEVIKLQKRLEEAQEG